MDSSKLPPIGLLAGWGNLPIVVAEAIQRSGRQVVCAAVKDHADPVLEEICDATIWVGLGQLGKVKRHFQTHQAAEATMAGKIHKIHLFDRGAVWKHRPDWFCFKTFAPQLLWGSKDRKDDTLLLAIVNRFESSGITFLPPTDFAPELLVNFGVIAGPQPTGKLLRDIQFGWEMAKELGRLDVGQSVAVKNQAVLALEAIEGTDACIERAGSLCKAGGFTVVKVAKPKQDMRFDVPTIGVGTLQTMVDAGASTLVLEAEKTILLDEPAVLEFAKTHRLRILAVSEDRLAEFDPSSEAA
ncbi:LpxI family protein [Bremerella alba]|uniref:UDP-2,3-diacylglucosamine pyrophosphatase LpxI n=1 Tax=Bremerella alba TaxID=980252 RepID=A0A7V9A9M0_9BACT|nr:UDP-2,3-diacylglucosamine diphosphatase LpxI [Bremerella alba]MBA2117577.1 UDP-2,3-diacylglucosamine pyrophosphatase LpxI [Bremerella alba]